MKTILIVLVAAVAGVFIGMPTSLLVFGEGVDNLSKDEVKKVEEEVQKQIQERKDLQRKLTPDRVFETHVTRQGRLAASWGIPATANPFIGTNATQAYEWLDGYIQHLSDRQKREKAPLIKALERGEK